MKLAISTQEAIIEEAEYYGIYDPSIINVGLSMMCFKLIEYWGEIFLKSAFLKLSNKLTDCFLRRSIPRGSK
ncbi:hypothetical protein [Myxosarcina sp. GI1]|uniref:hypothetical protein n=1 Tax=Myxosarcina sp. GI1 TaxID=1541065 RepID=UPI00155AEF1D|nr:hypothetical protein [Myxosarcina sp. GI1]